MIDYARDFGSAPDSYRTTFAVDGARHRLGSGLSLGVRVDAETSVTPDEDNDGVAFDDLQVGSDGTVDVFVINDSTGNAMIDAWIDFDRDGSFDTNERIFTAEPVSQG